MNDQRKVIFEQRLGVIKNQNIYNVVNDIFDEIVENLISEIHNYRDSYDANSKKLIKTKTERLCGIKFDDNKEFLEEIKASRRRIKEIRRERKALLDQIGSYSKLERALKRPLSRNGQYFFIHNNVLHDALKYFKRVHSVIGIRRYNGGKHLELRYDGNTPSLIVEHIGVRTTAKVYDAFLDYYTGLKPAGEALEDLKRFSKPPKDKK
jgi:preprotein translocase subunit SecA